MGSETLEKNLKPKKQQRGLGKIHEEEDFISEDSSDNFDDRLSKKIEKQSKNRGTSQQRTSFVEARNTEFAAPNARQKTEKEIVPKEMPKDEAKRLMTSTDFINWFSKSSRHVERALSCEFDIQEEFFTAEETEGKTADEV